MHEKLPENDVEDMHECKGCRTMMYDDDGSYCDSCLMQGDRFGVW